MKIMNNVRKFVAPEFVTGEDSILMASQYAKIFGANKAFLLTGKIIRQQTWFQKITDNLRQNGVNYVIYDEISPNPRADEVMAGAKAYNDNNCDVIISVGGGSVMDCSKGIAVVAVHNDDILKFEGVNKVYKSIPPLIFIPTTAGSSSDVSQFTIINDTDRRVKIAIISKLIVPDIALIDPVPTTTMDPYLTACTGIDALAHAVEAYVSNISSLITDNHSLAAIQLVKDNLKNAVMQPNNLEVRSNMMIASLEAGLAFSNASLGVVHAMSHSLGGYLDLPHGECISMVLPSTIKFNFDSAEYKYQKIAEIFYGKKLYGSTKDKRNDLKNILTEFVADVGIEKTLGETIVELKDIPRLSVNAESDPCLLTNPKRCVKEDIEEIYNDAY